LDAKRLQHVTIRICRLAQPNLFNLNAICPLSCRWYLPISWFGDSALLDPFPRLALAAIMHMPRRQRHLHGEWFGWANANHANHSLLSVIQYITSDQSPLHFHALLGQTLFWRINNPTARTQEIRFIFGGNLLKARSRLNAMQGPFCGPSLFRTRPETWDYRGGRFADRWGCEFCEFVRGTNYPSLLDLLLAFQC
jgi:hypothetical protein